MTDLLTEGRWTGSALGSSWALTSIEVDDRWREVSRLTGRQRALCQVQLDEHYLEAAEPPRAASQGR